MSRTESDEILLADVEIFFTNILVFIGNDNQALKSKSLTIFSFILKKLANSTVLKPDSLYNII